MVATTGAATAPVMEDQAWLDALLPMIRVRWYRPWTFFPARHEVVGLSRDELVVYQKRASVPIPEAAYEPGGLGALRESAAPSGRIVAIPLGEVERLTSMPRSFQGQDDLLEVLAGGRRVRFRVRQDETPNLYRAFGLLLGPRYVPLKRNEPPLVLRRLAPGLILLAIALLTWFLGGAYQLITPIAGFLALIALVIGLLASIPGRPKVRGKTKARPLKDLSGRQPIRLRIAGTALTICGAVFVLAFLGAGIVEGMMPLLPGGLKAAESWYAELWDLAQPAYSILVGGSVAVSAAGPITAYLGVVVLILWAIGMVGALVRADVAGFYGLLGAMSPYIGLLLIRMGRGMVARNAQAAIAGDSRTPILYLRSFEDDVEDTLTPHNTLARLFGLTVPEEVVHLPAWLRAFYELHALRLLRSLFGLVNPTTEAQFAGYFRAIGPFIAIGKPGERLATIGASREYVDDARWQEVVLEFMDRSRFVVLQAAGTEGFLWELRTVLERVAPEKILFCLSNFRGRQNEYEDFRLKAESVPGWRFPRSVGNHDEPQFLYFEADRTPVRRTLSYLSPVVWPVLGQVSDLRHTLAGFVDRTGKDAAPYAPKRHPLDSLIALVLFLTVIPLVWSVAMYALLKLLGPFLRSTMH